MPMLVVVVVVMITVVMVVMMMIIVMMMMVMVVVMMVVVVVMVIMIMMIDVADCGDPADTVCWGEPERPAMAHSVHPTAWQWDGGVGGWREAHKR